jgi:hypothetical protein
VIERLESARRRVRRKADCVCATEVPVLSLASDQWVFSKQPNMENGFAFRKFIQLGFIFRDNSADDFRAFRVDKKKKSQCFNIQNEGSHVSQRGNIKVRGAWGHQGFWNNVFI